MGCAITSASNTSSPTIAAPSRRATHGCERSGPINNNRVGILMAKPKHKNGGTIMSSSERDLALAKALLDRGEMDAAEELLDKVESKMSAQAAADDGDDDQDEDTLDQEDDTGDDEEDDGEDDGAVSKAFRSGGI